MQWKEKANGNCFNITPMLSHKSLGVKLKHHKDELQGGNADCQALLNFYQGWICWRRWWRNSVWRRSQLESTSLAPITVGRGTEDVSSDMKTVGARGMELDFFLSACDESADASGTTQLTIFMKGVYNKMRVTEELLDLQSLHDQPRGTEAGMDYQV